MSSGNKGLKVTCDSVHTLLERNKILQVHVPNNCTDLLQPLDLSVNKPFKDKLRSKFSEWYTLEVSKQLEAGTQVEEVHVDMRMSVMRELSSQWFISAYNHIQSNPDIFKNGFKKAGITEALEKGLPEADAELDLQNVSENDPFSSDSELNQLDNLLYKPVCNTHNQPLFLKIMCLTGKNT